MKEHIYTIPINDAFDKKCECPVCEFMRSEEKSIIEYTLGASMMEPDERVRSNKDGYCNHHFSMLLEQTNKLSLALILQTHLSELRNAVENDEKAITAAKKSIFKKDDALPEAVKGYERVSASCVVCDKLFDIQEKFIDNIIELYKKEDDFKKKFDSCKGFCIPHFSALAKGASQILSETKRKEFLTALYRIEIDNLKRIQEDIDWFTKKFDFRFANEDWKNSRDAVLRTTEKIIGYTDFKER